MRIIHSLTTLTKAISQFRQRNKTIGFVPTMGYFHEGHLRLMRKAKKEHDYCIVSLYVNPAQFGPKEDLAKYPRDFKRDASMARKENVDILFMPTDNDIYPNGYLTYVDVGKIADVLCGQYRPGHFRGVATIVTKLLMMVRPDSLYLGQKDAQQVIVLKQVVRDLNIPVDVKVVPTAREADGLAMSSRNKYLNQQEREQAPVLYEALQEAVGAVKKGEHLAHKITSLIKKTINSKSSGKIQYVACVDVNTLKPVKELKGDVLIALAVYFGKTRLIDNIVLRR